MGQKLDRSPGAEIGATDTDDDQDVGILTDLGRGFADAGEFGLVILGRQVNPAEVVIPGAAFLVQLHVGDRDLGGDVIQFFLAQKAQGIAVIKTKHGDPP